MKANQPARRRALQPLTCFSCGQTNNPTSPDEKEWTIIGEWGSTIGLCPECSDECDETIKEFSNGYPQ